MKLGEILTKIRRTQTDVPSDLSFNFDQLDTRPVKATKQNHIIT